MPEKTCLRCQRPILYPHKDVRDPTAHIVEAIVEHCSYGCDTGCCGHQVVGRDCSGRDVYEKFEFTHPGTDDPKIWATELADEHLPGVPLNWEDSEVIDD